MLLIAMIGGWHVHTIDHANSLKARAEDCEIVALWDDDPRRGKELCEKIGCAFVPDYGALLADPSIDIFVFNTATTRHRDQMIAAARAGKHIFTEKNLAATLSDGLVIAEAIKESGVTFGMSYQHRLDPQIVRAKELVDAGVLGELSYVRFRKAHSGVSGGWLPERFLDEGDAGGGALIDLGAHALYSVVHFLGMPKTVQALLTSVGGKGTEDNAVCLFEGEHGAIGVAETGFLSLCDPLTLELSGTKGHLCCRGRSLSLCCAQNGKKTEVITDFAPREKISIHLFLDAILAGKPMPTDTLDDALCLLAVTEAAYRSHSANGAKVSVK